MTNVVHFLPLKVCISDTKGSSEFLSENAIGLHVVHLPVYHKGSITHQYGLSVVNLKYSYHCVAM